MCDTKRDFYSTIADQFDDLTNLFDRTRRLEVMFSYLKTVDWNNSRVVDVGCGSGAVSLEAQQYGAFIIGCDISPKQLRYARSKGVTRVVACDALSLPYPEETFDIILSSDAIEHTAVPEQAIQEMVRILKPNGILVLTCPNHAWKWLLNLAILIKLRPYEGGFENFPTFSELKEFVTRAGLRIEHHIGLHPWPFQITFLQGLSHWVDDHFGRNEWGHWMINQAIVATKPGD